MFPSLYHAHHNRHLDDLPFWLNLANQRGDPILELGCGTGRVLLPLASAGHRMYGLDHHSGMLNTLRQGLEPELRSRVSIWQGNLTSFRIVLNFPLIIMPCNTFSTLSLKERQAGLGCIATHLLGDGAFAASLPNPSLLQDLPDYSDPTIEESFPHPLDSEPVQVSSGWMRSADHFTTTWHYDHLRPDGSVERTTSHVRHNLASIEQIAGQLEETGLWIIESYGDFDRTPYSSGAPYFIFLAARQ
jgi:SAM-dependent methyltransferase